MAEPPPLYVQVLEKAACEALGMGSYLGVAEASDEPPKFIHLTYRPGGAPPAAGNKVLALVGKGLTFDSGGYNMKVGPGSMIELMKVCGGGWVGGWGHSYKMRHRAPWITVPRGLQKHKW